MQQLSYRKASLSDFDDFFAIKSDKANIEWGGFLKAPDYNGLKEWYKSQLKSESRTIYLVFLENKCVSFFYIDKIDNVSYELSSSGVLSDYCGQGIGSYTVKVRLEIIKKLGGRYCFTWIAEDNIASYKRFENLGFRKTTEFETRELPKLGGMHRFYKYERIL